MSAGREPSLGRGRNWLPVRGGADRVRPSSCGSSRPCCRNPCCWTHGSPGPAGIHRVAHRCERITASSAYCLGALQTKIVAGCVTRQIVPVIGQMAGSVEGCHDGRTGRRQQGPSGPIWSKLEARCNGRPARSACPGERGHSVNRPFERFAGTRRQLEWDRRVGRQAPRRMAADHRRSSIGLLRAASGVPSPLGCRCSLASPRMRGGLPRSYAKSALHWTAQARPGATAPSAGRARRLTSPTRPAAPRRSSAGRRRTAPAAAPAR